MVIRPYTELHQPGIEFGLTYFDDPGVNIPSAITAWVAMSGIGENRKTKTNSTFLYYNLSLYL